MRKFILLIGVIISIGIQAIAANITQLSAQKYEYIDLGDISRVSKEITADNGVYRLEFLPRNARVMNTTRSEIKFKDVTLSKSGTLASTLGDEINEIDSLVVRGPINAEDFHTIWRCSFYGGLTVANLEYAQIEGNKIPKNAFWYQSEQYTPGSEYIDCIILRRIILPEGLVEIGEGAFCYAINLENVNFPSSLRTIKKRCFSDCISLNVNPLIIPEGVEEIGYMAFVNCKSLTGRVSLPTSLNKINGGAFFSTKITECNFPDGLEEIGDAAFYAARLKEAIIETDNFPSSGIDSMTIDGKEENGDYYDLSGRKVETLIPGNIYVRNGKKILQDKHDR